MSFDRVGLPGFQFVQDGLAYMSRTWHTDLDTIDHVSREDLMQAATIMASFLYHASMRPERFPRKPMPLPPPPKPVVEEDSSEDAQPNSENDDSSESDDPTPEAGSDLDSESGD
jgi:hypothetical protein